MCYGLRAVQAAPGRQAAILDDQGQRVRAERPQIGISANGEPLVVFRRFGKVGANAEFAVLPNVGLMAPCLALRVCL